MFFSYMMNRASGTERPTDSIMLTAVLLKTYGISPPPAPDATSIARAQICDADKLCSPPANDAETVECGALVECKNNVTTLMKSDGTYEARRSPHPQRDAFVALHYDILNVQILDKTISAWRSIRAFVEATPAWLLFFIFLFIMGIAVTVLFPALVILYVMIFRSPIALAKILAVVGLLALAYATYTLVPK